MKIPFLLLLAVTSNAPAQGPLPPASPPPSSFYWIDLDRDGDQDALAIEPDGSLRLLRNDGAGTFVDATAGSGLDSARGVRAALFGDWDLDGEEDLVLATARGVRSYLQASGVFLEVTSTAGLADVGPIAAAAWVDANGDRRPDLHLSGNGVHRVFANEPSGLFRELDLWASEAAHSNVSVTAGSGERVAENGTDPDERDPGERDRGAPGRTVVVSPLAPASDPGTPAPRGGGAPGSGGGIDFAFCPSGINDQAVGTCVSASSVPTLGMLYPLGNEFSIDAVTGNVGMGTTTPGYALEVAGKIVSGSGNSAAGLESAMGGGKLNSASGDQSTIAGGESNSATAQGAFVGGGLSNSALSSQAAIVGGAGNRATYRSFTGGGTSNAALGNESAVAGGRLNEARQTSGFVGGGELNISDATHATIAGGRSNSATGTYAAVPGGLQNSAAGAYSLAAGRRAQALHDGSFAWGDSTDADLASTAPDQFLVRAAGGVGIGTDSPTSPLTVEGAIESTSGGFVFPDGSSQSSATSGVPTGALIATESATAPTSFTATGWTVSANTGAGSWIPRAPIPTPRGSHAVAAMNGRIYAVGGGNGPNQFLDSLEEYDPGMDSWSVKAPMPGGVRAGPGAAAVGGKLYVIGGIDGAFASSDRNEVYDPTTDTWSTKAPLPLGGRRYPAVAVIGQNIFVVGGQGGPPLSTMEMYDTTTDTWTTKAPMPGGGRYLLAAAVLSGKIYAIGGWDFGVSLDRVEEYDPATDTWKTLAAAPEPRSRHSAVVLDEELLLVGGYEAAGFADRVVHYAPPCLWEFRLSLPTPRITVAAVAGGKLYAVSGSDGTYLPDMLELDPGKRALFLHQKD
jgi:N-acetylneuraminic acid mutarotase